jgi:two-component system phosphate regulon sensor histidine kinase PhoR
MRSNTIRWLIVLGTLSIIGIIAVQWYWVTRTLELKESEFHQSASIALKNVATKMAEFNKSTLSHRGLITRVANNYYVVNVNSDIDANVLETYLLDELYDQGIDQPFEYGIYDCQTNELVYGNCCDLNEDQLQTGRRKDIKVDDEYVYYFVVRFPSMDSHILSNMPLTILLSLVTLIACLIFVYAMYVLLQQKRFSELQRDFINNITHEFKTPLSSIKLASESFLRNKAIQEDDRLYKYATIIRDQNQHLNHQVEKVLNLAKIEQGNIRLTKEPIDLHDFIGQFCKEAKLLVEQNNGSFTSEITGDLPVISADEVHLKNVLFNLVENGIKYSNEPPQIHFSVHSQNDKTTISIKDKGIGIEKSHLQKLFDKFYRISTGNVHDAKGFGLGLYYVKMITDMHNWQLHVDSIPNEGSTFSILIKDHYLYG